MKVNLDVFFDVFEQELDLFEVTEYRLKSDVPVIFVKFAPFYGTPVFFDYLLPLMNVTFVRNEQLTILPFPFKYLREYINLLVGIYEL